MSPDVPLDHRTDDHRALGTQAYDDCQLLQLADLMVGGFGFISPDKGTRLKGKPPLGWPTSQTSGYGVRPG
jgi:hypothetical protein